MNLINLFGKRAGLVVFFFFVALFMTAQTVSLKKARENAVTFMKQMGWNTSSVAREMMTGDTSGANTPYYIFNGGEKQGFVIVSGDERTLPILGYVEGGEFDEERIPDNMRSWMKGYAQEIKSLQNGQLSATPWKTPTHQPIAKMINTKWSQGSADGKEGAYNMLCPKIDDAYCLTGCLATAMAQVMYYHRWPQTFSAEIPAYTPNTTIGELPALSACQFDWENMLNKYVGEETTQQKNAVATLMRYCGQSVGMNYGTSGSGATCDYVPYALRSYFGYDINSRHVMRSDYTAAAWDELIYNELKQGRPVIYSGSATGGGHAFICDGYDGRGFYHVNWGWGGYLDGYFRLSVMNPEGGGAGSSGTSDGYTMAQGAIVGIQPPTGFNDEMRALTLEKFYVDGYVLRASFSNRTGLEGKFEYGFIYHNVDDQTGTFQFVSKNNSIAPLYIYGMYCDITNWEFSDGIYRFYPFSRLVNNDWYRVIGDFKTYLQVTVREGNIISIEKHPQPSLSFSGIECVSNKVVSLPQEIKLTATNSGDEFNGLLYLFASKNSSKKGNYCCKTNIVVEEGTSEETKLYFTPTSSGTWYVWVCTNEKGTNVVGQIQVEIKNLPTVATKLEVVNCDIDARPTTKVFLDVKNTGSDSYYLPIISYLFKAPGGYSIDGIKSGYLNLAKGETASLTYEFDDLEPGVDYFVCFQNYTDHQNEQTEWLGDIYFFTVGNELLRGDANDDGQVDISDVLLTVDYILGKPCEVFVLDNADVMQDGEIDISDVLGIVDIILGK